MARRVRDALLDSREARRRLKARGKPYYRLIERGLHLGYRKLQSDRPGTWVVRLYTGNQTYAVKSIGAADDYSDVNDGPKVLDFGEAQNEARKLMGRGIGTLDKSVRSVSDAFDLYFAFLKRDARTQASIKDAQYKYSCSIEPELGSVRITDLTTESLREWRDKLAKTPGRLRGKKGEAPKYRKAGEDSERKRMASANRVFNVLKAALNHAFNEKKISNADEWRRVKPFGGVTTARVRYLTIAEAKRLINACDPEFRPLVHSALLTGGRYGQLIKLRVNDFNPDAGTVTMRTRKGGGGERSHHVVLTAEGVEFFEGACAGKSGGDLIFTRNDGSSWGPSHQIRPIAEASARAKIEPAVNFHVTRHSWASNAIMGGVPLLVVARNLGHKDTRMVELHYGHLAASWTADAIRKSAPKFGIRPRNGNLVPLQNRSRKREQSPLSA